MTEPDGPDGIETSQTPVVHTNGGRCTLNVGRTHNVLQVPNDNSVGLPRLLELILNFTSCKTCVVWTAPCGATGQRLRANGNPL